MVSPSVVEPGSRQVHVVLGVKFSRGPPGWSREQGNLSPNPTANLAGAERLAVNTDNRPGRHRAPGGYSPLGELQSIARASAQPAIKGAAVVAAAGGLVATISAPASADTITESAPVAAAPVRVPKAAATVGPDATTSPPPAASTALSSIGYVASAPKKAAKPKPIVIKDVVIEKARKEAAEKARREAAEKARKAAAAKEAAAQARRQAAARKAAEKARKEAAAKRAAAEKARKSAERASRTSSRTGTTKSTYKPKTSLNKTTSKTATSKKTTVRATTGKRSSYNWATRGQCTWGALNKWYQSEGYYPGGWTGNAMEWAWGAANAGYTVSSTPRTRSIVVLQPGVHGSSRVGHVGWVTGVSGNKVTMIEMNALAGAYNYNTRTVTHTSGMKYIYAP